MTPGQEFIDCFGSAGESSGQYCYLPTINFLLWDQVYPIDRIIFIAFYANDFIVLDGNVATTAI